MRTDRFPALASLPIPTAAQLRARRREHGISLALVADRVGLDPVTFDALEAGALVAQPALLREWAATLEQTIEAKRAQRPLIAPETFEILKAAAVLLAALAGVGVALWVVLTR